MTKLDIFSTSVYIVCILICSGLGAPLEGEASEPVAPVPVPPEDPSVNQVPGENQIPPEPSTINEQSDPKPVKPGLPLNLMDLTDEANSGTNEMIAQGNSDRIEDKPNGCSNGCNSNCEGNPCGCCGGVNFNSVNNGGSFTLNADFRKDCGKGKKAGCH